MNHFSVSMLFHRSNVNVISDIKAVVRSQTVTILTNVNLVLMIVVILAMLTVKECFYRGTEMTHL